VASGSADWLSLLPSTEPPFELGDGIDVFDTLASGAHVRTETLLETHPPTPPWETYVKNASESSGFTFRYGYLAAGDDAWPPSRSSASACLARCVDDVNCTAVTFQTADADAAPPPSAAAMRRSAAERSMAGQHWTLEWRAPPSSPAEIEVPTLREAEADAVAEAEAGDDVNCYGKLVVNHYMPNGPLIHGHGLISGDYKLLHLGHVHPGEEAGWHPPPGQDWRATSYQLPCDLAQQPAELDSDECVFAPCLFDIAKDPCEYHDLATSLPEIVDRLSARLAEYQKSTVDPVEPDGCNPVVTKGIWRPCDAP